MSIKGKEKVDSEIDWTGWEPHNYHNNAELERLQFQLVDTYTFKAFYYYSRDPFQNGANGGSLGKNCFLFLGI